jgi:hypothetical protein
MLEASVEAGQGRKAALDGDIHDALRRCIQQEAGVADLDVHNILLNGYALTLAEDTGQVHGLIAKHKGSFAEGARLFDIALHVPKDAIE